MYKLYANYQLITQKKYIFNSDELKLNTYFMPEDKTIGHRG